jgi:hypothetical protein
MAVPNPNPPASLIALTLRDAGLVSLATAARSQFVQQTSLVIAGIRAGYLIDAFPFPQHKLEPWHHALATRVPGAGTGTTVLYEISSGSTFIVNRTLLLDNLKSTSVPLWVNTHDCSIQVNLNPFAISKYSLHFAVRHTSTSSCASRDLGRPIGK